MPETNNMEEKRAGNTAPLFAILYSVLTLIVIFSSVGGFSASLAGTGIVCPLLTMLFYYEYLTALGENVRQGALAVIVPTVFSVIAGFWFNDFYSAFSVMLSVLSHTLASFAVYSASKNNSRSWACTTAAFVLLAFSLLGTVFPVIVTAVIKGVSFSTVLFDTLSAFVSDTVVQYTAALESASSMLQNTAITAQTVPAEYLESVLSSILVLSPAIMYAVFFFGIYIFTRIADFVSRVSGVSEKNSFGSFIVSPLTNRIFNISAIIVMLSLLFETEISAFTFGVLSVLILVLPNYVILGIRRIYGKLSRVMSGGAALAVLAFILLAGLALSSYLLIMIIVFFGTSEYRASVIRIIP